LLKETRESIQEEKMANFLACVLMGAITFPLSFFIARGCLQGLIRLKPMARDTEAMK
jgi:hypothetical protein